MNRFARQVRVVASQQHDVVAGWQLRERGWSPHAVREGLRGLRRVFRGVCALGDLTELGWYMAAALSMGPSGRISHLSAVQLMELYRFTAGDIHVAHAGGGRVQRAGLVLHRQSGEAWTYKDVPTVSPTQALLDADLKPYELYRALDIADERGVPVDLPVTDVVRLKRTIQGRTKSEAEAAFLWLMHTNGLPLPRVNHHLNGFETDFHWPELRLVVEVDGWHHHKEKPQFQTDRYRGLVHRAHGWEVIRISADHVYDEPELVVDALTLGREAPIPAVAA